MKWDLGLERSRLQPQAIYHRSEFSVLTLDSDGGGGVDGATESGSAGVQSSLRC